MNSPLSDISRQRARGVLLGQLTGDALGTTLEFMSAAEIRECFPDGHRTIVGGGPFDLLAGQVTDDSELALALARTLADRGPDLDAIASAYVAWCNSDPFDIGGTIMNAFSVAPPVDAVAVLAQAQRYNHHPKKQANGSLMRVSPWGIFGASLPPDRLEQFVRVDSMLSHPALACQEACVAFTRAIAAAIAQQLDRRGAYEAALVAVDTVSGHNSGVYEWLETAADEMPVCDGSGIGWVRIALQNAFHQLLNAPSLEAGVVATVMAGGDTDTNAAIAGALLGAVHGVEAIPEQWWRAVLDCRTGRGPTYQTSDARALADALWVHNQSSSSGAV